MSFVRHLNKNRQVVHQRPIYAERNINGINIEVVSGLTQNDRIKRR